MQRDTISSSSVSAVSFCPSFNTYSSDKLADTAARVSLELKLEESNSKQDHQHHHDDDDDFEFFSRFDAQIHQVFPVFNRDLLKDDYYYPYTNQGDERTHVEEPGWPLKKLFVNHDDDDEGVPPSPSSSDGDEPEGEEVPELAFCIWSPKRNPVAVESSPSRCKKSNSTGSSAASASASSSSSSSSSSLKKLLKFRNLLKRSNSDGKDSFVHLSKPKERKGSKEEVIKPRKAAATGVSAHEAFYVKNRAIKEGDKKRSYLPYRPDLLGFFANYNGLPKSLPPF